MSNVVRLTDEDAAELSLILRDKVGVILGGMPDLNDVAPSAILIILYAALFAPIVWRLRSNTITFGQIWKPLLFILMRIVTFSLRIELAQKTEWNKDIFITQLIFLRLGPIILTSALVKLFGNAVLPYLPTVDSPNFLVKLVLRYFVSLLNLATYFCLGLTIAVAFDVKQAINGSVEARAKLHRSKQVSIWLLVVVNASIYFLTILPLVLLQQQKYIRHLVVSKSREHTKFMAVLSVCTFLVVVSAFKAAQLMSHGGNTQYAVIVNRKILFYCICCIGEYVACMILVTAAWARIVPPPDLLEAHCRIHAQRRLEQQQQPQPRPTPANQWPSPPAPIVVRQPERSDRCDKAEYGSLRAPAPAFGNQTVGVNPRQAVVHVNDEKRPDARELDTLHVVPLEDTVDKKSTLTRANTPLPKRASSTSLSTIKEVSSQEDDKSWNDAHDNNLNGTIKSNVILCRENLHYRSSI